MSRSFLLFRIPSALCSPVAAPSTPYLLPKAFYRNPEVAIRISMAYAGPRSTILTLQDKPRMQNEGQVTRNGDLAIHGRKSTKSMRTVSVGQVKCQRRGDSTFRNLRSISRAGMQPPVLLKLFTLSRRFVDTTLSLLSCRFLPDSGLDQGYMANPFEHCVVPEMVFTKLGCVGATGGFMAAIVRDTSKIPCGTTTASRRWKLPACYAGKCPVMESNRSDPTSMRLGRGERDTRRCDPGRRAMVSVSINTPGRRSRPALLKSSHDL